MAKTCGNCVYAKKCKNAIGSWVSPKNIAYCEAYKDSTNYVEVVHCKDCEHWIHIEDGMGDCKNARFHLDGHADPTMKADDFCSCGERREGE